MSNSVRPHRRQPTRLPRPWDSPGKNPGVGCHFLLQCMKVKNESEVAQSCPTLLDPMDCSPPGSPVHGIFQARVLEWGAIAFSEVWLASPFYRKETERLSNLPKVPQLISCRAESRPRKAGSQVRVFNLSVRCIFGGPRRVSGTAALECRVRCSPLQRVYLPNISCALGQSRFSKLSWLLLCQGTGGLDVYIWWGSRNPTQPDCAFLRGGLFSAATVN